MKYNKELIFVVLFFTAIAILAFLADANSEILTSGTGSAHIEVSGTGSNDIQFVPYSPLNLSPIFAAAPYHIEGYDLNWPVAKVRRADTGDEVWLNDVESSPSRANKIAYSFYDGTGDYLSIADSVDWAFGSNDFTIDFWFNSTDLSQVAAKGIYKIVGQSIDGATDENFVVGIRENGGLPKLIMRFSTTGTSWAVNQFCNTTILENTWYHAAFVRNGSNIYCYLNGASDGSATLVGTMHDSGQPLEISNSTGTEFIGYLDEIRISKGIARWTTAFTPSNIPYTSDANTQLLLHFNGGHYVDYWIDSGITGHTITVAGDSVQLIKDTRYKTDNGTQWLDWDENLYIVELYDQSSTVGSELTTNGDFTNWTGDNPDSWTLNATEDANNYITEVSGKARIVADNTTTPRMGIYQNVTSVGGRYLISIDITDVTAGSIILQDGGVGNIVEYNTEGKYYLIYKVGGATTGNLVIFAKTATTTDITIDNVSVKLFSGDQLTQTTAANQPRLVYVSNDRSPSMAFDGDNDTLYYDNDFLNGETAGTVISRAQAYPNSVIVARFLIYERGVQIFANYSANLLRTLYYDGTTNSIYDHSLNESTENGWINWIVSNDLTVDGLTNSYKNKTKYVSGTALTGTISSSGFFYLGAVGAQAWEGHIKNAFIYDYKFTDQQIYLMNDYLDKQ